ncbi:MAG: rane protein of unknown function [Nitrospira sp.]|jgi:hypothetical protein|nr:rane protein of unknown function [Nitrospira sp.]
MRSYLIFYTVAAFVSLLSLLVLRYGAGRKAAWIGLGLALSGTAIWMWDVSEPPIIFSDFTVAYYPAGRAVLQDIPHLFTRCWNTPVCGFVNIPIVAFLFTPFSMLTLRHAQWFFAGLSLISLLVSLFLLWSITDRVPARKWAICLLFTMNGPLFYSLKEGNLTHFVLLLLIAGVVCLDKTWDRSAGVFFALAAIFKLPLLLFACYFLGKRRWRVMAGYAATLVTVSAASLWYAGWASHVEWYREVILPLSGQGLIAFNVQSVQGLLLRLQADAMLYDWKPVEVASEIRMAGQLCAGLLVGLSCLVFLRRPGRDLPGTMYLELSMVLCLALVVSPLSWTHYYLLLLLPLALYAGNRLPIPTQGGWLVVAVLCILFISPPVIFLNQDGSLAGQLVRLFLSHYMMGALLLWGLLGYARWRAAEAQELRLVAADDRRSPHRERKRITGSDETEEQLARESTAS